MEQIHGLGFASGRVEIDKDQFPGDAAHHAGEPGRGSDESTSNDAYFSACNFHVIFVLKQTAVFALDEGLPPPLGRLAGGFEHPPPNHTLRVQDFWALTPGSDWDMDEGPANHANIDIGTPREGCVDGVLCE